MRTIIYRKKLRENKKLKNKIDELEREIDTLKKGTYVFSKNKNAQAAQLMLAARSYHNNAIKVMKELNGEKAPDVMFFVHEIMYPVSFADIDKIISKKAKDIEAKKNKEKKDGKGLPKKNVKKSAKRKKIKKVSAGTNEKVSDGKKKKSK